MYFYLLVFVFSVQTREIYAAPVMTVESAIPYPPVEEAKYRIYWNGLRLGKILFYWKEDLEHYEAKVTIKTSGIARVFSKQNRSASVSGRIVHTPGIDYYVPEKYEYNAKRKNKGRDIVITYNKDGSVKESTVTPPDDPTRREPVSDKARNAAHDPLTAMRAIQRYMQTIAQGGRDSSSTFTVFDGRRLTKIVAIPAEEGISCGKGCVRASGRRELLDGYTDEEKAEFEEAEEKPIVIEATPATSRFPSKIYTATPFGQVSAQRY